MQADHHLSRNTMFTCSDAYLGWVQLSALHIQSTDRSEDTVRYHARLLEKHDGVEVGEQRISEFPSAGPVPHSRGLSHPLDTDRFLGKPGEAAN